MNINKVYIYKIKSPSGKVYIGQSVDPLKYRVPKYRNNDCRGQVRLYNSIKKYGWEAHEFKIIDCCDIEYKNKRERFWQDYYDVLDQNKGLNSVLTETDEYPRILSEELKLRKSNKLKTRILSEEHKRKIGNAHRGKTVSESTREKQRLSQSGKKLSEETKKKLALKLSGTRNPMFGKNHSDETKKIIREKRMVNSFNSDPTFSTCVLNTDNGIYYLSIKEASHSIGMKYQKLVDKLNGRSKNNTDFIKV